MEKILLKHKRYQEFLYNRDENLDYTEHNIQQGIKKYKIMGQIKFFQPSFESNLKRPAEFEDSTTKKQFRFLFQKKSQKINFRCPKTSNFLFSKTCDEILKVNKNAIN